MAWQWIGSASIGPQSGQAVIGSLQVPRQGGLRLKITGGAGAPFQFGYCLLSFESTYGRELGTIRVWPRPELTAYHLGADLSPVDTFGRLVIEPRTWNTRWIRAGFSLTVGVLADLPSLMPDDRFLPDGLADDAGADLVLTPQGEAIL
jgi:hypothetical protein